MIRLAFTLGLIAQLGSATPAAVPKDAAVTPAAAALPPTPADLRLANVLLADGDFTSAALEFQRVIEAEPADSIARRAWEGLARAQLGTHDDERATWSLRAAEGLAPGAAEQEELRLRRALIELNSGRAAQAHLLLLEVQETTRDSTTRRRARLLAGIGALREHQWKLARDSFRHAFEEQAPADPNAARGLDSVLGVAAGARLHSPALARRLSYVPGLGQFYAGDVWNGVTAIALNGVAGWWLAQSIEHGSFVDIASNAGLLLGRYYLGNRYQAGMRAERRDERRAVRWADECERLARRAVLAGESGVRP